jgi:hypothetical protein
MDEMTTEITSPQVFKNEKWSIEVILEKLGNNSLDIRPPYQRRKVWNQPRRNYLIDSIARGVPCGAISVIKRSNLEQSGNRVSYWDVVDGQQRLQTIKEFFRDSEWAYPQHYHDSPPDKLKRSNAFTEALSEYGTFEKFQKNNSELAHQLLGYEFAVLEVIDTHASGDSGDSGDSGVPIFLRMNKNVEPLNEMEIRHAQYNDRPMLKQIVALSVELDKLVPAESRRSSQQEEKKSFFEHLGIFSENSWTRMGDYDILIGLCVYAEHSQPADRRDEYDDLMSVDEEKSKVHIRDVKIALEQLLKLCDNGRVTNLVSSKKYLNHHIYDLAGVLLLKRPIKRPQLNNLSLRNDLRNITSDFMGRMFEYDRDLKASRKGSLIDLGEYSESTKRYAESFSGQQNSRTHRKIRNEILTQLFESVFNLEPRTNFSDADRDLVWIKSTDKKCEADPNHCGNKVVPYSKYQLGHIKPSWEGGLALIGNGRVECEDCNSRNNN